MGRSDLLPPGEWVPNDFKVGDRIEVEGQGVGTVISGNNLHYYDMELLVDFGKDAPERVWPNLEWMTYAEIGDNDETVDRG